MKKKLKDIWLQIAIIAAILAVIGGSVTLALSYQKAVEELAEEQSHHLLDIAWSTDRNIASLFNRCYNGLSNATRYGEDAEKALLEEGDPGKMQAYLENSSLGEIPYLAGILVMKGDRVLVSSGGTSPDGYSLTSGHDQPAVPICRTPEGRELPVFFSEETANGLRYAALLDIDALFGNLTGRVLTEEYWVVFYDGASGLALQCSSNRTTVTVFSGVEVEKREDGFSVLARAEQENETVMGDYSYVKNDEQIDCFIAAIPKGISQNGVFTVGIAVESSRVVRFVNDFFTRFLSSTLIVFAGVFALAAVIFHARRKSNKMREELILSRKEGEAARELLERREEVAHRQRLELIGTMTSGIAHEFNNLLTPIMGYSIMSMEKLPPENEELMENLSEIYEASHRAKTLVSRLSALARKNSDDSKILLSPYELGEKAEEMALPSKPENVELIVTRTPGPERIFVNETSLVQLLLNLLLNAFQATEEKGGLVKFQISAEGGDVLFRVSDTGIGIPKDVLPHIFEPFFTTKERDHGTGLGLAIAMQTVETHNGQITVESSEGVGTTFTVIIPGAEERDETES